MIDKKIHYVWMGRGQKSELIIRCLESWKKHLGDYEIIEWNEDNFDISSNVFVQEAYQNKKWAFVSDYIRLYVLYNHGGIYMDTDVEILKPIDRFLQHRAFSGFESIKYVPTALMGAEKGHPWIESLLKYYENKSFINIDGKFDLAPNVVNITEVTTVSYGLKLNNKHQILENDLHIYPKEYFCPSDYGHTEKQKRKKVTINSYSIHHFNGSWLTMKGRLKVMLRTIFGSRNVETLKRLINRGL